MNKFYRTSTHGNSDKEMQLSQRAAPLQTTKGSSHRAPRFPSKLWTRGKGTVPEKAYYVTGDIFTPDAPTYTEICIMEEERRFNSFKNDKYRNPWLAGKYRKDWYRKKMENKMRENLKEARRTFQPQTEKTLNEEIKEKHPYSVTTLLQDLAGYAKVDVTDELIEHVEGIVALAITLSGCTDELSMISAIFLYLRKFLDKSVASYVKDYISDLFEVEPQSGDDTSEGMGWVEMIKAARDNWAVAKGNKLFTHFSKLLGLIVSLEMCKASDLTFSIKEYKIFEPDLRIVHGTAVDIIDAGLSTVAFFVENLSLCWSKGSLKPLLMNDSAAAELDEEYANIVMWWDLVKNGNLKRVANVTEQEFDRRLETLTTTLRNLLPGLKSFDKKLMNDKFMRLLKIKNDYITMKISSGVRKSPYCIELFGASSQGKTTFGEQVIQALLTSAGLPTGKEYQASYNASDKFMSTWTTDKLVLLIDDMANDKSNFVERPPTRVIIDVANNAPYYANMADLDSKGKIFVEPELVVVTTNVKDLDARTYSNCPYSIQRRMHVVITVSAKEEFQYVLDGKPQGIDPTKVAEFNKKRKDLAFDDIWELTLEKAVCPEKLSVAAGYAPITWKGKKMTKVSFRTAVQYLIEDYHRHTYAQENILDRMKKRNDICICGVDGCKQIKGWCDDHPEEFENQSAWYVVDKVYKSWDIVTNRVRKDIFGLDTMVSAATGAILMKSAKYFDRHWDWMYLIPTPWMKSKKFTNLLMFLNQDKMKENYIKRTCILWGSVAGALFANRKLPMEAMLPLNSVVFAGAFTLQKTMITRVKDAFRKELLYRNTINDTVRDMRDKHVSNICKGCALIGAFYGLARVYQTWKKSRKLADLMWQSPRKVADCYADDYCDDHGRLTTKKKDYKDMKPLIDHKKEHRAEMARLNGYWSDGEEYTYDNDDDYYEDEETMIDQGALSPTTKEEIAKRDASENIWSKVVPRALPIVHDTRTTTSSQLMGLVSKNLVHGTAFLPNKKMCFNGFFVDTDAVLVPDHIFEDKHEVLSVTFKKVNPDANGGEFHPKLNLVQSVKIPNSDLRLCYPASGGSFKDLTRFFPREELPLSEFSLQWRNEFGEETVANGLAVTQDCSNGVAEFRGLYYQSLNMNTFRGMCGATLISPRRPIIMGFHLGGKSGTPRGCAGYVDHATIVAALAELDRKPNVLRTGSAEHFESQVFGIDILTGEKLHEKSPVNYMPEGSQVEYYGRCPGMSMFHSNVRVTPISTWVASIMNAPNIYRGPIEKPQWFGWQNCLANLSIPARQYDPRLLILAANDYKEDMLKIYKSDLWKDARPLTDHENLCGIPGKKFMDAIKLNTSIGYPLGGPKRDFVQELSPTEDKPNNREFDPVIMDEINRCLKCYKRGDRAYVIAKACKKDEVLTKDKCRIFYGNGIALTYLIRKYFLPIIRIMQFNPKVAECAVGVNSHGPEWQELHEFIHTFGEDRLIGGDYGKYDQKLTSQLILTALRILIDFAKECDYTEEDIRIMEAMCGDIVYAIIAFNGDLIGLTEGTHISGNSLTVIINGICGSLNLRCYFYEQNPAASFEERMRFRDYVKLMTYGDDNIGSVSPEVNNFTIKGASEFLDKYGQTYTMPDKESELLDFLPPEEFEFLKRKSVYHPKLGVNVGALSEKSCFKMLHCYVRDKKSPLSENHACAQNIDTALREWFNHGETQYEKRRKQLKEVAASANITHLCAELEVSYDDRVAEWKNKYTEEKSVVVNPIPTRIDAGFIFSDL